MFQLVLNSHLVDGKGVVKVDRAANVSVIAAARQLLIEFCASICNGRIADRHIFGNLDASTCPRPKVDAPGCGSGRYKFIGKPIRSL